MVPIFIGRGAPTGCGGLLCPIHDAEWSRRCAIAPTTELAQLSVLAGKQAGVSLQVERPTLISGHALADALPALAVAVEIAVLDLDPRALRGFGDEPHFPLARFQRVVLDLPPWADVPALIGSPCVGCSTTVL